MHTTLTTRAAWLAPLAGAALLAWSGIASAQNYQASLERGAHPDSTPEQRYRTAIREAGGGLKLALAMCREQAGARASCERQARATYQQDMAFARELRRNPDARPTEVPDTPIESTEIVTVREIPAK